ncbi:MAG: DUF6502 family protein [Pseudomonadota bacterium]
MKVTHLKNRICKALLLSLARFALRHSIRLRELLELLKQVLIECAVEELNSANSPITAARLSVMTGVHRKDVDRLINQGNGDDINESSLIARIIGQWQGDPKFSTRAGQPKILSFDGSDSEFSKLVRSVTSELNPSLVLTELERVGAVSRHSLGLKLLTSVYVPKQNELSFYKMLGEDTHDLALSVEHNIHACPGDRYLHIKTEYDAIPDSLLKEVSEWILREGTLMHKRFSDYLSSRDKDVNHSLRKLAGRNRVAVASFSLCSLTNSKLINKGE